MRIANNTSALSAFNFLTKSNSPFQKTLQQLSSGLRINSAADDAAGLAISEKMRSQISGLDTAVRNTQDGISLLQTAEGGLEAVTSLLQRMRELSVQAANDVLTQQEVDRVAKTTQFNKKKLLDGSAGALWSSSDPGVKAKIHGALMGIDQFGQKVNPEGNYEIEIHAEAGKAQVLKSSVISWTDTLVTDSSVTEATGYITPVTPDPDPSSSSTVNVVFVIDVSGSMGSELERVKQNIAKFKERIESTDGIDEVQIGIATYGTPNINDPNFVAHTYSDGSLWSSSTSAIQALMAPLTAPYAIDTYNYYAVQKAAETYGPTYGSNRYMVVVTDVDHTDYRWSLSPTNCRTEYTKASVIAALKGSTSTDADDIHISCIAPNPADTRGEFYDMVQDSGGVMLQSRTDWSEGLSVDLADKIAEETLENSSGEGSDSDSSGNGGEVNYIRIDSTTSSSITTFQTSEGVSLIDSPQKITITQGNGKSASVTLYANDTVYDIAEKINNAIADGLGQGKYTDDAKHFCTISDGIDGTSESVGSSSALYARVTAPVYDDDGELVYDDDDNILYETSTKIVGYAHDASMVIRSVVPGKEGELTFSGDEDLLNALGLNEIQSSTESTYTISVTYGLIADNVDVEFDSMSGISAAWNDKERRYTLTDTGSYKTVLHLADNTMMLQTGSNQGEDFILRIGDMSADALGVDRVNVMSHDRAARSITVIDNALDKVLTQRAHIGASENALEHTMSSLIISHENLTAAESRIRSADIAKMMMMFTKINIMRQANMSMLAQANQLPQNVLSLIR